VLTAFDRPPASFPPSASAKGKLRRESTRSRPPPLCYILDNIVAPLYERRLLRDEGPAIPPSGTAAAAMDDKNKLYFGDNLKILREYVPDASVDLIYLDPPFNSSATYNVLFKEKSGAKCASQVWPGVPAGAPSAGRAARRTW